MLIRGYARRAAIGLALAVGLAAPVSAAERPPVLVELFTSQGCSSCPPADAYLGDLAAREDVIALSYHVNYWDYLGWKDPFASAESTRRQKLYAAALGQSYVYTPQMVVAGAVHEVGSRRAKVDRLIKVAQRQSNRQLEVTFAHNEQGAPSVVIPAASGFPRAEVWMVLFDAEHSTPIRRGENGGRTLTYHNVVRSIERLGTWDGSAMTIPLGISPSAMEARDGCVVIVQGESLGPVLGAAVMPMTGTSR